MLDYPSDNTLVWETHAVIAEALFNGEPRLGFEWWDARKSVWKWMSTANALSVPNGFDLLLIRHQSHTKCENFGQLVSELEDMVRQAKVIRAVSSITTVFYPMYEHCAMHCY